MADGIDSTPVAKMTVGHLACCIANNVGAGDYTLEKDHGCLDPMYGSEVDDAISLLENFKLVCSFLDLLCRTNLCVKGRRSNLFAILLGGHLGFNIKDAKATRYRCQVWFLQIVRWLIQGSSEHIIFIYNCIFNLK